MTLAPEYTDDQLFAGRLQCLQPQDGYRFSLDAVLLANLVRPRPAERILELGAGCGVVSLILAYRWPEISITALEIQPRLAELCRRNVSLNGFADRIRTMNGDLRLIRELVKAGEFSLVVANPPYLQTGAGRINRVEEKGIARHELKADMKSVVGAARYAVEPLGRVVLIYPAARAAALINQLQLQDIEPNTLQFIYSYFGEEAGLVIVEAIREGGEELRILPPFYVYKKPGGGYSEEMSACYEP